MKTVVCDLQYGDSGKGRVSACLVKDADWSIKTNGGNNSGHTVYDSKGRSYKFHHLTAGAAYGKKVAIDTGAVLNLAVLRKELDLLDHKVDLYISENVHLVDQTHLDKDSDGSGIGSTKTGMAYVYADRALRKGHRITPNDLDKYQITATLYRGLPPVKQNEHAIYETAQGIMLDVDYGDYPYVTSSSVMPSMVHKIDKVIGVMKAYTTRVGLGPPNHPDISMIRDIGNEYGTTTGRPRKCMWNDVDQIKYAMSIAQPDEIVVTKMDVLGELAKVHNICVYVNNELVNIGSLDDYKAYLLEVFPQITHWSEAPSGDLIRAA